MVLSSCPACWTSDSHNRWTTIRGPGHEYPFDGDAVVGEECRSSLPERGGGGSLFVGEDLAVGEAAVAVDGGVHEGVADLVRCQRPRSAARPLTRQPPPLGIRPSFLMSTWTSSPGRLISIRRIGARVTRSRWSRRFSRWRTSTACTVEAGRPTIPAIRAGPSPRRRRSATIRRSRLGLVLVGRAVRTARAVLQPRKTLGLVAAPPDIGPITGDPHRRRRMGDRPASLDPLAQQQSASRGQTSVTVHESLRCEWVVQQLPHSPGGSPHRWTLSARSMGTTSSDVDDGEVRHEGTFAFVDLAGFTALTEAHGDAEAVAIVRAFRERARRC